MLYFYYRGKNTDFSKNQNSENVKDCSFDFFMFQDKK
jgi:hypothetical protein